MNLIDVSMYQGDIDWKTVAKTFKCAYLKASEGLTWNDPDFQKNREAANAAGVRIGAYHFCDFDDPELEANHFCKVVGKLRRRDLKPVLDMEKAVPKGVNSATWAHKFNARVHSRLGRDPMFYSYAPYIEAMKPTRTIGNGLWIAGYGRNDGKEYPVFVPIPWKHYVAHQFTSKGKVAGIKGGVDISAAPHGVRGLLAYPVRGLL